MPKTLEIDLRRHQTGGQDRLDLGCEQEMLADLAIEQRLLPHMIARQEQRPVVLVPDRKSEHAAEMLDALGAVVLVEV